jgi:hypothetical protein
VREVRVVMGRKREERNSERKSSISADYLHCPLSLYGEIIKEALAIPEMPMTANPSLLPSKGWS